MGVSFNGRTTLSKRVDLGSIPSTPAMPLDIGLAFIAAVLGHTLFGLPLGAHLVVTCVVFIVLVDIDCLFRIAEKGWIPGFGHEHRDWLHWPLIYMPLGTVIIWYMAGWQFGVLFLALSLAHFIHDSIGVGWGVAWLRPFSSRYYKFFSRPAEDASVTFTRLVVSWTPEEQKEVAAKYGNPYWIRDTYIYPKRQYRTIFLVDIIGLIVGTVVLIHYLW